MSRTRKGTKSPGTEYWKSHLHPHSETPGKNTKKRTHKKERAQAKKLTGS